MVVDFWLSFPFLFFCWIFSSLLEIPVISQNLGLLLRGCVIKQTKMVVPQDQAQDESLQDDKKEAVITFSCSTSENLWN
jgi:hypothetical protein